MKKEEIITKALELATKRHQVVGRKDTYYIEIEQLEKILGEKK